MVSSYAIDDGDQLLLLDPLAAPTEIVELAADRETAIVPTCPWHERDARRPLGVEAFPGREPNDLVLWIENGRAVIAGDTLVDFGQGLEIPPEWLPDGITAPSRLPRVAPLARAAGRARARDPSRPDRPSRTRARSRLTPDPSPPYQASRVARNKRLELVACQFKPARGRSARSFQPSPSRSKGRARTHPAP